MTISASPSQAPSRDDVRAVADQVRARVLRLTLDRDGCYLSQAASSAEILATLYTRVLRLAPTDGPLAAPEFAGVPSPGGGGSPSGGRFHGRTGPDLDRLLISPAHYAVAVYAALIVVGRLGEEALSDFNIDGTTLEMIGAEHSPGFELTTGSFGQALSQAGGIAMARRRREESGRTVVFVSDGELEEGQTWEALQALAFHGLDRVLVYIDVNGQQVDGYTKDVMNIEPIADRIEAFGGQAITVDGHDPDALAQAADHTGQGRPVAVLAYTNSSQGLPMLEERKPNLHFVRFRNDEERRVAEQALSALERELV